MKKKAMFGTGLLLTVAILSACGQNSNQAESGQHGESVGYSQMDHASMDHSSAGVVPEGLTAAKNPAFKVGGTAIIRSDHMEGMKGAEATIAGAYETVAYVISYQPVNGGEKVESHKWVIQEEIKEDNGKLFEPGAKVILNANHMEGMEGADATIESAQKTTVYMVDYQTSSNEQVVNHKWVTEYELKAM
jgi:hypothetical protein